MFDDLDGSYFSDPLASIGNTKSDRAKRHRNDGIMNKLLSLLGCEDANWRNFELEKCSINGFKYSIVIGESILINIDGPKSSRGRPVTQLLMRGEGCREFIEYQKGSWVQLFHFLTKRNGKFKRVDLAIDDFTASEVDIYDLEKYAKNKYWSGSFQSLKVISDMSFRGVYIFPGFFYDLRI